ncbi:MAG: LptE family protein [Nitrospirae bacterium]|nr:LptE family protein [Nitrospirota bacterium]
MKHSRSFQWTVISLLCTLLLLSSCGYHMAGTGSHLQGGVRSVFIPVFENKTMEPIVEEEFTPAVIREFMQDARIEVADSSGADMVLKGEVLSYNETPVSFDASQNVLEYRIAVRTHLILLRDNPIWERDIVSTAEYTVSSDVMKTRIAKLSALREAAGNLAEEVVDRVLLGW